MHPAEGALGSAWPYSAASSATPHSMPEPRNHHYLSQCYLKGFAETRSKEAMLHVWDLERRNRFKVRPRGVGAMRDFNRVEADGMDPNLIETGLGKFETDLDAALGRIIEARAIGSADDMVFVCNLMAMVLLRHPSTRDLTAHKFGEDSIASMKKGLESREAWAEQVRQMRAAGVHVNDNVTYEQMHEYINSDRLRLQVDRSHLNRLELQHFEKILPYFIERYWSLYRTDPATAPFIASDRPVFMMWADPEKRVKLAPPGLKSKNALLFFPLSKELALLGHTAGSPEQRNASYRQVAMMNGIQLHSARSQVYAPHDGFTYAITTEPELRTKDHVFTDWSPVPLRDEGGDRSPFPRSTWG